MVYAAMSMHVCLTVFLFFVFMQTLRNSDPSLRPSLSGYIDVGLHSIIISRFVPVSDVQPAPAPDPVNYGLLLLQLLSLLHILVSSISCFFLGSFPRESSFFLFCSFVFFSPDFIHVISFLCFASSFPSFPYSFFSFAFSFSLLISNCFFVFVFVWCFLVSTSLLS